MSKFSSLKTSSAGSYLGFYAVSALTTAMFICAFLWHLLSGSPFRAAFEAEYLAFIYIVIAWVGLGWLMCLIAGIGFDILPLIHGSKPFHENAMRQFLIINFAGQSVIFNLEQSEIVKSFSRLIKMSLELRSMDLIGCSISS